MQYIFHVEAPMIFLAILMSAIDTGHSMQKLLVK